MNIFRTVVVLAMLINHVACFAMHDGSVKQGSRWSQIKDTLYDHRGKVIGLVGLVGMYYACEYTWFKGREDQKMSGWQNLSLLRLAVHINEANPKAKIAFEAMVKQGVISFSLTQLCDLRDSLSRVRAPGVKVSPLKLYQESFGDYHVAPL